MNIHTLSWRHRFAGELFCFAAVRWAAMCLVNCGITICLHKKCFGCDFHPSLPHLKQSLCFNTVFLNFMWIKCSQNAGDPRLQTAWMPCLLKDTEPLSCSRSCCANLWLLPCFSVCKSVAKSRLVLRNDGDKRSSSTDLCLTDFNFFFPQWPLYTLIQFYLQLPYSVQIKSSCLHIS